MVIDKDELIKRGDYQVFQSQGKQLSTFAHTNDDGRLAINLKANPELPDIPPDYAKNVRLEEFGLDSDRWRDVPKMGILIMVVGSRGDIQPFVALGQLLALDGHFVRVATLAQFKELVVANGLNFFDIGGSNGAFTPYMLKTLLPTMGALANGDVGEKRKALLEMMQGCWRACHEPSQDTQQSFAADAIIANPSAFAHIHIAEALGIPLHMSCPMPWTPTVAFPHPLVYVSTSNAKPGLTNALTYGVAEQVIWQGVGDLVNSFRKDSLGLESLGTRSGSGILDRLRIPWTYCMSPTVVPRPDDWMSNIDVSGFYISEPTTNYVPSDALSRFLGAGDAPVYVEIGSVPVMEQMALATIIFEASRTTNLRVLLSTETGRLRGVQIPNHAFVIGDVPHDWLFDQGRVQAVIHRGDANTTAIGLLEGRPTAILPCFGDQAFWGNAVWSVGVGPKPIPPKELNARKLVEALLFITNSDVKATAMNLAKALQNERGLAAGVESFYRHLPLLNMRCDLDNSRLAVWWSAEHYLKLSAFAVQILLDAHMLDMRELEPHRPKEYETRREIADPITGGLSAAFWLLTQTTSGVAQLFYSPWRGIIKTTIVVPFSAFSVLFGVSEGMHNAPRLYGSQVRPATRPKDWKSGLKEGGKSMYFGIYDGLKGLYQLPAEGAKKDGVVGALKGSAISLIDLAIKPAAGALNFVSQPIEGSWRSMQSLVTKRKVHTAYLTRIEQGLNAMKQSSNQQREEILQAFAHAKSTTKERQEAYRKRAVEALEQRSALDNMSSRRSSAGSENYRGSGSSSKPTLPPYQA